MGIMVSLSDSDLHASHRPRSLRSPTRQWAPACEPWPAEGRGWEILIAPRPDAMGDVFFSCREYGGIKTKVFTQQSNNIKHGRLKNPI